MATQPHPHRLKPRISANDLALYMVSSETAKIGIIRRSKFPQKPPIIRYRDVRAVVVSFLSDPMRDLNPLIAAEDKFRKSAEDTSISSLMRDDALHSIDVVQGIQSMSNQLGGHSFHRAPAKQEPLEISSVIVSVRADLLVHGSVRGVRKLERPSYG